MILPTTNISIMSVRNALSYPSTDLGTLCTCPNVNKYSRFRPGYWYVDTSGNLAFQKPRGGGYNDPRGTDPSGISVEAYKLGDFRGYNHNAPSPSLNTGSDVFEITFPSSAGGGTKNIDIVFNLGETDWFGQESQYRGKNNITTAYDTIYAARINGSQRIIVGSCSKNNLEISGNSARAPMTVSLYMNPSGTTTYTLVFGLGYAGKAYAWFPNELTIKITVLEGAVIVTRVLSSALSGLKNKLVLSPGGSVSPSTLQEVIVYGGEKSYTSAVISASFTDVSFVARMSAGQQFKFTELRLPVSGTVYCYDRPMYTSGAVLKSQSNFNMVIASSGYGVYNFTISLPETANDGEYFYVDIKEFTGASVAATQI